MTPSAIDMALRDSGFCYSFRFVYQYIGDATEGYGERWCRPPAGVFETALYDEQGTIVVIVRDYDLHTPRPQPSIGWYCGSREAHG
jgi:hypothetical protein